MSQKGCRASGHPEGEDESDGRMKVHQADDPEQNLSTDIVLAVSEASGSEPTDLPPLNKVIDGDALDQLFAGKTQGNGTDQVSFNYNGYRVTVYRDGEIVLQERGGTDSSGSGEADRR